MHCHLLIPNLIPPTSADDPALRGLSLPALETLLARGREQNPTGGGMEAWLCRAFNVTQQHDWPVAPLTLLADGGEPREHYWLRADPVHLQLMRDRIILADSASFALPRDEAEQLADALNRHFHSDGMIFYPVLPQRWYLRLAAPADMRTHSLAETAGKHIDAYLPSGPDGMRWHTLSNEIQMLLHNHPVNEAREARGEMPVNSVWLWGGGTLPASVASPFSGVWADEPLARGLARAAKAPCNALPTSAAAWLASAGNGGEHLIVLDGLRGAAQYGDMRGWREGVECLERDWFAPLADMLKKGQVAQLSIAAVDGERCREFTVERNELWKFWRGKKPLTGYL
jgi:hypothetical protein